MEEADLAAVMAIERLSFPSPWHESTFRGEIQNEPISFPYVVIHKVQKRVAGYIVYWLLGGEVQVNNLAVHPDFRQLGIGEAVMREVIRDVKKRGVKAIYLEVRPSNAAAIQLYKKLGFTLLAVRRDYYLKPREDAYVLYLALD